MNPQATVPLCPVHDSALARKVGAFCLEGHAPPAPAVRKGFPTNPVWRDLQATGTALWLDTGDVGAARELWTQEFVALTTNNTLLNTEVQKGIYDQLMPRAKRMLRDADPGISDQLLVQEVAFVLNAVHGLMLVRTFDADVSVELHTNLAYDTEASYQYGKRFAAICPDRFIVKVPLTPEGLFAARRLVKDGIRVNFTLGFSARENYLIAIVAKPTWVNVFMGRANAFVTDNKLGDGKNVGEKATLGSQRMLRRVQRELGIEVAQIGASMRNGQQVYDLMGLDVFTMPVAAAKDYLQRAPARAEVNDRTAADPAVTLTGRSVEGERLDTLWAIPTELDAAMRALAKENLDRMTGDQLRAWLRQHQLGDLFPELSAAEKATITNDGKIPKYAPWAARVQARTASWDGLLTEAALASFTSDQKKLDDRIRAQLG